MIRDGFGGADEQPATTVGRDSDATKISRDACRLPAVGHPNIQVALVRPRDAHDTALRAPFISAELEKPWVVYDAAEIFTDQGHSGMIRQRYARQDVPPQFVR